MSQNTCVLFISCVNVLTNNVQLFICLLIFITYYRTNTIQTVFWSTMCTLPSQYSQILTHHSLALLQIPTASCDPPPRFCLSRPMTILNFRPCHASASIIIALWPWYPAARSGHVRDLCGDLLTPNVFPLVNFTLEVFFPFFFLLFFYQFPGEARVDVRATLSLPSSTHT